MAMLQEALVDQSQVYLPINNALSSVGHVHGFIQELGQARTLNAILGRRSSLRPSYVPLAVSQQLWFNTRRASSTWQAASTI